jgi:hypothetical protein
LFGAMDRTTHATVDLPHTAIILPKFNVPVGEPVLSDTQFAYVLPNPLFHASSALQGWSDFHDRLFVTPLRTTGSAIHPGVARMVAQAPRGLIINLWPIAGGWQLFSEYAFSDPAGPWTLYARDNRSGRTLVLDSAAREGVPSLVAQGSNDGHTAAWQSWTQSAGRTVSVIRSYNLQTGERRLLAEGGSITTWSYDWPSISGHNVVFEKQQLETPYPHIQIMFYDLQVGQVRALTPTNATNSEPSVSGNLVVWKLGARFGNGRGVGYKDVTTGKGGSLAALNTEQPKAVGGRYAVFSFTTTHNNSQWHVQAFDTVAKRSLALGLASGNVLLTGEHTVAYYDGAGYQLVRLP